MKYIIVHASEPELRHGAICDPEYIATLLRSHDLTTIRVQVTGDIRVITVMGHWPLAWLPCFDKGEAYAQ